MDGRGRLGLLAGPEHGRTRSTFRAGYAGLKKNLAFFCPPHPNRIRISGPNRKIQIITNLKI
jgi:hypothetical protein